MKSYTADRCGWCANARRRQRCRNAAGVALVRRPTPRYFEPMEPMLAVRGGERSCGIALTDKRSPDGRLQCRWPSQVPVEIAGLVKGADLVAAFPPAGCRRKSCGSSRAR